MSEQRRMIRVNRDLSRSAEEEWLGGESHMPNLSRELRRRETRPAGVSSGWLVSAMFVAGLAAGCLVMRLFDRRSQVS